MKRALIVVNLAGFLNFLWHDIETLQYMGYKVSVAMNGKLMDGSYAVEIPILKEKGIDYFQIDFDTKSPLAKENVKAYLTSHPEIADEIDKMIREKLVK